MGLYYIEWTFCDYILQRLCFHTRDERDRANETSFLSKLPFIKVSFFDDYIPRYGE